MVETPITHKPHASVRSDATGFTLSVFALAFLVFAAVTYSLFRLFGVPTSVLLSVWLAGFFMIWAYSSHTLNVLLWLLRRYAPRRLEDEQFRQVMQKYMDTSTVMYLLDDPQPNVFVVALSGRIVVFITTSARSSLNALDFEAVFAWAAVQRESGLIHRNSFILVLACILEGIIISAPVAQIMTSLAMVEVRDTVAQDKAALTLMKNHIGYANMLEKVTRDGHHSALPQSLSLNGLVSVVRQEAIDDFVKSASNRIAQIRQGHSTGNQEMMS